MGVGMGWSSDGGMMRNSRPVLEKVCDSDFIISTSWLVVCGVGVVGGSRALTQRRRSVSAWLVTVWACSSSSQAASSLVGLSAFATLKDMVMATNCWPKPS